MAPNPPSPLSPNLRGKGEIPSLGLGNSTSQRVSPSPKVGGGVGVGAKLRQPKSYTQSRVNRRMSTPQAKPIRQITGLRVEPARRRLLTHQQQRNLWGFLFALPAVSFFALFSIYPIG